MTDVEIRPLRPGDDLDAQVDLSERAFGLQTAPERELLKRSAAAGVEAGLFLGVFVGGRPAGAATYHDMRQWWHGRSLPMAGVAGVKIAPEYRGRGLGRRLMTELLGLIAERGYPVSALYPATMPIYRSLGWEEAGSRCQTSVPARELHAFLAPDPALPDSPGDLRAQVNGVDVRRATPDDAAEVIEILGRAHEAARHCGPLTRDERSVREWLARDGVYAYLAADGFLGYQWDGGGTSEVFADRVVAVSGVAYRALWSVLASHSTMAGRIRAKLAPEDPLWWLTRERDVEVAQRAMWMLRIVDAPAAIAGRGFPPSVSLSVPLVIADPVRPSNDGRWRLEVAEGKGALTPDGAGGAAGHGAVAPGASGTAGHSAGGTAGHGAGGGPLTLGARGLAALYGGTPLTTLRHAGLVSGGSPEGDAALDAAFPGSSFMLDDF